MKKFKDFINEEIMPYAHTEKGFVGVDNGPVRDNINVHLTAITARPYATPYHALEMVRKVLAPYHIGLPATNFLAGDSGHEIFEIAQFGEKIGMKNNGDVVTKIDSPYFVYFEYAMNDSGGFDIFCEIVNQEELDELMSDIESEMENGDDDYYDDMNDAADSFDGYKSDNHLKEEDSKEYKRNWKYVKMHTAAAKKAGEYMDKGQPNKARLKVKMMKRIYDKIEDKPKKLDEVSSEYLDKKLSKADQLIGRYAGKQNWTRAEKKVDQVKKIEKYMKKKGMKSKAKDENQERYDSLKYKGD
jgi:hypothetical protein